MSEKRLIGQETISSVQELVRYFLTEIPRIQEIISGGTPSDDELVIGGADRDSAFAQIWASIIGRANDIPPEIMSDVSRSEAAIRQLLLEEITRVNQEVNEAGSWDAWAEETGFYDQELTGDPGPVKGDPPRQAPIQPEPEPEPPEQVGINLEDFQTQFPDLDPSAYEDGMYTDPTTGTVYVINIPPDLTEPEEEEETDITEDDTTDAIDDGADDLPSDTTEGDAGPVKGDPPRQAPIDPERPWEYIGNGRFRHVTTGEIITDPNYDPSSDLYEVGGNYSRGDEESLEPEPEPEPAPIDPIVGPPGQDGVDGVDGVDGRDGVDGVDGQDGEQGPAGQDGIDGVDGVDGVDGQDGVDGVDGVDGTDGTDGTDGQDGAQGERGRAGKDASMFTPFMTSIGYTPVQLQQLVAPPKKDYFRELDGLIGRSLFGKMIK